MAGVTKHTLIIREASVCAYDWILLGSHIDSLIWMCVCRRFSPSKHAEDVIYCGENKKVLFSGCLILIWLVKKFHISNWLNHKIQYESVFLFFCNWKVHRLFGHMNRPSRNVDVYPEKQRVPDTLCVLLISVYMLMLVVLSERPALWFISRQKALIEFLLCTKLIFTVAQ